LRQRRRMAENDGERGGRHQACRSNFH
jgi:hypothetical protein